jgi:hypothetical protein
LSHQGGIRSLELSFLGDFGIKVKQGIGAYPDFLLIFSAKISQKHLISLIKGQEDGRGVKRFFTA